MKRIAVFASGSGSNAENLINYFNDSELADISVIFCNRKEAGVRQRAERHSVPFIYFTPDQLKDGTVLGKLKQYRIDFIVLAGFLLKIPKDLIEAYPDRIVNIHPALLPDYGGKGMYGMRVHEAVVEAGEQETGITIHYVNENYDQGEIIFQATVEVYEDDSPEDVAEKVHELEYKYYPQVVEDLIASL